MPRGLGHRPRHPSVLDPKEKHTLQTRLVSFIGRTGLPCIQGMIGMIDLIKNAGVN